MAVDDKSQKLWKIDKLWIVIGGSKYPIISDVHITKKTTVTGECRIGYPHFYSVKVTLDWLMVASVTINFTGRTHE